MIKNARSLAACLMAAGYDIVSGGTDTHVMLLDLRSTGQCLPYCDYNS